MNIKIKLAFSVVVLMTTACATTSPSSVNLKPGQGKGAVIAKLSPNENITRVTLGRFNGTPEQRNNSDDTYDSTGLANFKSLYTSALEEDYLFTTLSPGTYFYDFVGVQSFWIGCFEKQTYIFDVEPDAVTHIGVLNFDQNALEIKARAISNGQTTLVTSGVIPQSHFYHDLPSGPNIRQASHEDIDEAEAYLAQYPDIDVPVKAVNLDPFAYTANQKNSGGC